MPKRKRHQPGKYKPKPEIGPNFIGTKPLTLFMVESATIAPLYPDSAKS